MSGGMDTQEIAEELWDFIQSEEVIFARKPRKLRIGKRHSTHYSRREHLNAWYAATAVYVMKYWNVGLNRRGIARGADGNKWLRRSMANRWQIHPSKK